jgi:hypothetical protein
MTSRSRRAARGPGRSSGIDPGHPSCQTGASLPTVIAPQSRDTRYPPLWSTNLAVIVAGASCPGTVGGAKALQPECHATGASIMVTRRLMARQGGSFAPMTAGKFTVR